MRTITLEEHYASPRFLDGPGRKLKESAKNFGSRAAQLFHRLTNLSDKRIAEMDAAGIDLQVLSLTAPGVEQLDAADAIEHARDVNDYLADAIKKNPTRFAGFAALPTPAPEKAAQELQRMVQRHGFKGAMINGHSRGRYLDDAFFWPILECAEALGVPIYLHPTPPPQAVISASYSGFDPTVVEMLAGAGWGWHIETAIHVIRLVLGGALDKFPKLQLVIGHMGEALPFMLQRLDMMPVELTKLRQPVSVYLRNNVHYTFSGFNFMANFLQLLLQVGIDRIMFSADYPYASMDQARMFLEQLPLSTRDRERIAHGNAERLLSF